MKKLLLFLLALVVVSSVFFRGCNDESSASSHDETPSVSEDVNSPEVPEEEGDAPVITNISVGETIVLDDLEFTVLNFNFSKYIIDVKGGNEAGENNKYCNVEVSIYNPTPNSLNFTDDAVFFENTLFNYTLVYNKEYKYYSTWIPGYTNFIGNYEDIRPLETITAYVCFEVPEQIVIAEEEVYMALSRNDADDETEFRWILREGKRAE